MQVNSLNNKLVPLIAGLSLALTLLTNSRSDTGVGPGELGIAISASCGLILGADRFLRSNPSIFNMPHILLGYGFLILLPLTAISFYGNIPGSSLRDWIAYILSYIFVFSLSQARIDLKITGIILIIALSAILLYQYFSGSPSAWYSSRFTGGAKNPNQLALYCICATTLVAISFSKNTLKIFFSVVLVAFGISSGSDAYLAAMLATAVAYISTKTLPPRALAAGSIPLALGLSAATLYFHQDIIAIAEQKWSSADEGGSRIVLYQNGILAWMDSINSILIGNGAGNYSGLSGPFQGSEAHNTPIDILSIGGIIGVFIFYLFPSYFLIRAYKKKQTLIFSLTLGLLVFSMFHFVARHPVWWFTILSLGLFVSPKNNTSPEVC